MKLWIRSQNREDLLEAEHLGVYDERIYINGYDEHGYCIGEYATKERALEVLDEMQEYIQRQGQSYILTDEKGQPAGLRDYGNIYEMPKE